MIRRVIKARIKVKLGYRIKLFLNYFLSFSLEKKIVTIMIKVKSHTSKKLKGIISKSFF